MKELSHIIANQQKVYINLFSDAFHKLIDAIADHSHQPDFIVYKNIHNHRKNICRRFHMVAQCSFTTSERELSYYQQKVNLQVVSRAAEQLKFRILENYQISRKSLKCFELIGKNSFDHTPKKF